MANTVLGQKILNFLGRLGIDSNYLLCVGTGFQPALQHGAAHFAATSQNQCAFESNAHASPCVSNMALANASSAVWPAQITN